MTEAPESQVAASGETRRARKGDENLFERVSRFTRETVLELRRVVWPTKQQVTTYTGVVLVFVVFMALLVAAIDIVAGKGVLFIFGN